MVMFFFRLPYLEMVIVTDSRQPGMLHVDDVMQAGESRHHRELMDLQSKLSFDDPHQHSVYISNIQCFNFFQGTHVSY